MIIHSPSESRIQGRPVFWNKHEGWVDLKSAQDFSKADKIRPGDGVPMSRTRALAIRITTPPETATEKSFCLRLATRKINEAEGILKSSLGIKPHMDSAILLVIGTLQHFRKESTAAVYIAFLIQIMNDLRFLNRELKLATLDSVIHDIRLVHEVLLSYKEPR